MQQQAIHPSVVPCSSSFGTLSLFDMTRVPNGCVCVPIGLRLLLLLCPPGVVLHCDPQTSNQQQQRPVAVQRCSANSVPSLRFRTTVPLAHIRVRGLGFNGIFRFFHPKIAFFFFTQGTRGEEKMSEKGRQRRRTPTDCAAWMRFVTVLLFFSLLLLLLSFSSFFPKN